MSVDDLSTALIRTLHICEGIDNTSVRNKRKSDILDFGVHLDGYQHEYKWMMEPEEWAQSCACICVSTTRDKMKGHPIALDEIIGDDIIDALTDILLSKMSFLDACQGNFRLNVGGFPAISMVTLFSNYLQLMWCINSKEVTHVQRSQLSYLRVLL